MTHTCLTSNVYWSHHLSRAVSTVSVVAPSRPGQPADSHPALAILFIVALWTQLVYAGLSQCARRLICQPG